MLHKLCVVHRKQQKVRPSLQTNDLMHIDGLEEEVVRKAVL